MMTMNYFWWLFRDLLLHITSHTDTIKTLDADKLRYTMDFMVELEEGIAQKLEREDSARAKSENS